MSLDLCLQNCASLAETALLSCRLDCYSNDHLTRSLARNKEFAVDVINVIGATLLVLTVTLAAQVYFCRVKKYENDLAKAKRDHQDINYEIGNLADSRMCYHYSLFGVAGAIALYIGARIGLYYGSSL